MRSSQHSFKETIMVQAKILSFAKVSMYLINYFMLLKKLLNVMENSVGFLKKLKTELPCDPTIPLLGTYLKKMKALT